MRQQPHVEAGTVRQRARGRADVDAARLRVAGDQGAGADHIIRRDLHAVVEGAVDAYEAAFADVAIAGDHRVRSDEHVVAHHRAVADVVAAPQDAVVADAHERLDHVVLEDEAVLADLGVAPHEGARADVAGEPVALAPGLQVEARAQAVELAGGNGHEGVVVRGRMRGFQFVERHHRSTGQRGLRQVVAIDAEGGHVAPAVVFEVFAGDQREFAGPDEH
jgi:hypothetical protein